MQQISNFTIFIKALEILVDLTHTPVVKKLTHKPRTIITIQEASSWTINIGSKVQLSRLLFRVFFIALACVYALVMFEFIDPNYFKIELNVSADVLIMTLAASVFVYLFMRKPRP